MRLVIASRFGFSFRAVFSAKSTSIYKPGTTAKRALLCAIKDKKMAMLRQFLNGYAVLQKMYTTLYGGLFSWGEVFTKRYIQSSIKAVLCCVRREF